MMFGRTTLFRLIVLAVTAGIARAEEEKDSAEGLPTEYATNYLVARYTMSADKKFAVIYPTQDFSESKEAKDFLVALEPFSVLGVLPTDDFYYQGKSHGGISEQWTQDLSVGLIVLESKWGPGDVILVELEDGRMKRMTNVLQKLTQLLSPKFRAARPKKEAYNEHHEFIYEPGDDYEPCTLDRNRAVELHLLATNDPKSLSKRSWKVRIKAEWDIAQAKFTSQKITNER